MQPINSLGNYPELIDSLTPFFSGQSPIESHPNFLKRISGDLGGRNKTGLPILLWQDKHIVIRPMLRGGAMRWLGSNYIKKTIPRVFREFKLHKILYDNQFPTVEPIAAVVNNHIFFQHQWLLTVFETQSTPLHQFLELDMKLEHKLEQLIIQMDHQKLMHPDLNLSNILVSNENKNLLIIDWDKAELGTNEPHYTGHIKRLLRSANKLNRPDMIELLNRISRV